MRIHGLSKSPEYRAWADMRQRCSNPKSTRFSRYGGRGISVCKSWDSFEVFYFDMGDRPTPDHSIDRINNDLGYFKENCRWATRSQQQKNRSPFKCYLPKGDDHWTRKNPELAKKIARENIKNSHGSNEKNSNSKLTWKSSSELREFASKNQGMKHEDIGKIFGVGRETVRKIIKGIAW